MKPERDPNGVRLWAVVAATVRPFPGRVAHPPVAAMADRASTVAAMAAPPKPQASIPPPPQRIVAPRAPGPPQALEPGRHRRLVHGRDAPAGIVDLHGLNQDQARAHLTDYVRRAHAEGRRTVLVITGKGALGDGVLRRRAPEWLSEPPLRTLVAGLSEAHRRHGGEGALYVALKRR